MGSMRRDRDVTNQPAHDARPSSLHRRLTVALANASDRARLAELITGDLGALEADAAPAEALPSDEAAKDDGLATDLGGNAVPIEGAPDLEDDKAATNTAAKDDVIVN